MTPIRLLLTAGGGPVECRLALSRLLETVMLEAEGMDCEAETETIFEGDRHGPKSAIVRLEGSGAKAFAAGFVGPLKFVFPSPVRATRRKNWFLAGSLLELPDKVTVDHPRPEDMTFEAFQAGGAGGQHQNKTNSAVRLRHAPSGIVVVCRNERSQHQNKSETIRQLVRILQLTASDTEARGRQSVFSLNKDIERGNAVRTFKS